MQPQRFRLVLHGALGGLAAGVVTAGWFFVLDLVYGQPARSITTLSSALLGGPAALSTPALVVGYLILHFGVFVACGIGAALLLSGLGTAPGMRHGVLFGVVVFTSLHYGALLATGVATITLLPEVHVVLANILGGVVMMAVLHYMEKSDASFGLGALREHPVLARGITVGLLGGATVAVWFLVLDVVSGRPFFTPAALGSLLFLGATSAATVHVTLGIVAVYTVLHFAVFLMAGVALAWGTERVAQKPGWWMIAIMAFIVFEAGSVGMLASLGDWVLGSLDWWAILVGNLLAVVVMGRVLWKQHPRLGRLVEEPVETMV